MAGKTGTVQVVAQSTWGWAKTLPFELRDHAWFASFAPTENAELVVVVFVEHGGSGSGTAAPIAKAIHEKYFGLDTDAARMEADRSLLGQLSGLDWAILVSALGSPCSACSPSQAPSAELPVDYLPRQARSWVAAGLVVMAVLFLLDYHLLVDLPLPLWLGRLHGAGPGALHRARCAAARGAGSASAGLGFQPAEVAKLATALFLTKYLAGVNRRILGVQGDRASPGCWWRSRSG